MPAAICPRTKHETIPCILGENRSIRQLSMESLPARIRHCHPRATLARVFVAPPPNPRMVDALLIPLQERAARIGRLPEIRSFVASRCVFPYAKRQKAGSPIAAARFYDGKVNSILDDIPFVLHARRFVAACVRLRQRFPFAIREFLTDKFV